MGALPLRPVMVYRISKREVIGMQGVWSRIREQSSCPPFLPSHHLEGEGSGTGEVALGTGQNLKFGE